VVYPLQNLEHGVPYQRVNGSDDKRLLRTGGPINNSAIANGKGYNVQYNGMGKWTSMKGRVILDATYRDPNLMSNAVREDFDILDAEYLEQFGSDSETDAGFLPPVPDFGDIDPTEPGSWAIIDDIKSDETMEKTSGVLKGSTKSVPVPERLHPVEMAASRWFSTLPAEIELQPSLDSISIDGAEHDYNFFTNFSLAGFGLSLIPTSNGNTTMFLRHSLHERKPLIPMSIFAGSMASGMLAMMVLLGEVELPYPLFQILKEVFDNAYNDLPRGSSLHPEDCEDYVNTVVRLCDRLVNGDDYSGLFTIASGAGDDAVTYATRILEFTSHIKIYRWNNTYWLLYDGPRMNMIMPNPCVESSITGVLEDLINRTIWSFTLGASSEKVFVTELARMGLALIYWSRTGSIP
jgi:hypothetical protein